MSRRLTGKVVIATHNAGKLAEMRELLAPFGIEAVSAGELGLPEPEETGTMFAENAAIKAQAAADATGLPGLRGRFRPVRRRPRRRAGHLLGPLGRPGQGFRRRHGADLRRADRRGATDRRAHFVSALVLAWPDGHTELFEGRVFGDAGGSARGRPDSATTRSSAPTATSAPSAR